MSPLEWELRAARSLARAVEAKDPYTAGHAKRVTTYALILADELGVLNCASFRTACRLHDVGKIGVPDAVLTKPGPLDEAECRLMRQHPAAGVRILEPLIGDRCVLGAVRSHHERWDGTGYPDGLAGEQIPLSARILALADALDAMLSERAYRRRRAWGEAVAEVRRCSGTHFDPAVVEAFLRAQAELFEAYLPFAAEEDQELAPLLVGGVGGD